LLYLFQFAEHLISTMVLTNEQFAKSLTHRQTKYLWDHIHRYDGVDGVSAKEQFQQLVAYVLNFLTGPDSMEKKIYAKAIASL
jgi:hypothetical protein